MKNNTRVLVPLLLILIFLAGWVTLVILWHASVPPESDLSYQDDSESSGGKSSYNWIFRYRKLTPFKEGLAQAEPDFLIIQNSPAPSVTPEEARARIDEIKFKAIHSGLAIISSHSVSEESHSLYRREMEDFLQIKRTGWSLRYERSFKETGGGKSPGLIFSHEDGRSFQLKSGEHFDGKPPRTSYQDRSAEIYQWIPIFQTGQNVETVTADLHLTPQGRRLLQEQEIPESIPVLLSAAGPLVRTSFVPIEISQPSLKTNRYRILGKLWFQSRVAFYRTNSQEQFYWRILVPWLDDKISAAKEQKNVPPARQTFGNRFVIEGNRFAEIGADGSKNSFYIKGINLGAAMPGKWFTQFPQNEHLYYRFFSQIKSIHFNTIRIYTLFPPSFYRALKLFNEQRPDNPLFLIQEIWPEEEPPENNYWEEAYDTSYREEIRRTIDSLHGNSRIPPRKGRAWGTYRSDVSMWTLALLIGREMEPEEVLATNEENPRTVYAGEYISAPSGPATESWLASSCDYAVSFEKKTYGVTRPIGIVNWPTLDPLTHPSEWADPELGNRPPFHDKAVIDINRIEIKDGAFGGFFGAYHIYPNYPDFMNNQDSYKSYQDEAGPFRYGGYLREFIRNHSKYPAIVAEYGISTSGATAHYNPDGYHHGGLSENQQAEGIIRMSRTIRREGFAGEILFEWMDEWAKKTWTTEPLMVPYDRQALWKNVLDPEQNYGIIAMEGNSLRDKTDFQWEGTSLSGSLWGNESYLTLEIRTSHSWDSAQRILMGIDIYDRSAGITEFPLPGIKSSPSGMEFLVYIDMKDRRASVLAADSYNLANGRFFSTREENQSFSPIPRLVNRSYRNKSGRLIPPLYTEWGKLYWGPTNESFYSVFLQEKTLTIQLPWGLLNVSDPSSGTVLKDKRTYYALPSRDVLKTTRSDGILLNGVILWEGREPVYFPGNGNPPLLYTWPGWDVPSFHQREKKSVPFLREYFGEF